MNTKSLVLVEYINTLPFIHGIEAHSVSKSLNITTAIPSECAEIFNKNKADIALIPVGALPNIKGEFEIFSDFGIGCKKEVYTVALFSNIPIQECTKVYLDFHSKTSAALSQLLFKDYWKINIDEEQIDFNSSKQIKKSDCLLLIGDKVKDHEQDFKYKYDLGKIWYDWQKKPFVFAVWVCRKNISDHFKTQLNDAFKIGINNIDQINLDQYHDKKFWTYYLYNYIHYTFSNDEKQSMKLFLDLIK